MFDLQKETDKKETIFIIPEEFKAYFFELRNSNPYINFKFFTFSDIIKNLKGDFDDENIIKLALFKLSYTYSQAKKVVKLLFSLLKEEESVLGKELFSFLNLLKNEGYIKLNEDFLLLLRTRKLIFLNFKESNYVQNFIKFYSFNDYDYIEIEDLIEKNDKNVEYFEFFNIEEEVNYSINNLFNEIYEGKIESKNAKILCNFDDYEYYLRLNLANAKVPINFLSKKTLLDSKTYIKVRSLINDEFKILNYLKDNEKTFSEDENYEKILDVLTFYDVDSLKNKKDNVKEILSSYKLDEVRFKNGIDFVNSFSFSLKNKYYILGFDSNLYPKVKKDNGMFSYSFLEKLGFDSLNNLNLMNSKIEQNFLLSNSINYVSTHLKDNGGRCVKSYYFDELNFKKACRTPLKVEYLNEISLINYRLEIDKFRKNGSPSLELEYLKNYFNGKYLGAFDSSFKPIRSYKVNHDFAYSYSSLDKYKMCPFLFYTSYVLKLNNFTENYGAKLGNLAHEIVEHIYDEDFNFDSLYKKLKGKFSFTDDEEVLLNRSMDEVKKACEFLKMHEEYCSINENFSESAFNISLDVDYFYLDQDTLELSKDLTKAKFVGKIDKIIKTKDDSLYIIDYKTGSYESFSKTNVLKYGIGMQLPTYLFLLDKTNDEKFKNSEVKGLFISKLLLSNNDFYNFFENKEKMLRLDGIFLNDKDSLSLFDSTCLGEDGKGKFVKGLNLKKDKKEFSQAGEGKNKVSSRETLLEYKNAAEKFIKESIKGILEGNFKAEPFDKKSSVSPCTYCDAKDLCLRRK